MIRSLQQKEKKPNGLGKLRFGGKREIRPTFATLAGRNAAHCMIHAYLNANISIRKYIDPNIFLQSKSY